ncbi:6452_t:CDS:2, partial [Cetraspora pellucida]
RTELENLLNQANHDREIAIECGNRLAHKCSILDKNNKHMQQDLNRSNKDKEKLTKHTYQLIDEVKRLRSELNTLTSQITRKDISLNESKIKIKNFQSKIKILEMKLSSTQNKSKEILTLRSMKKILEASKINEIECLGTLCPASQKTKDILDPVVMGGAEKNTQSEEQSFISNSEAESKSLVKYFKSKKKMEAEINDTSLTNQ